MQMSILFYLFRPDPILFKRGLWGMRYAPAIGDDARAAEEVFTYLAFDIFLCALAATIALQLGDPSETLTGKNLAGKGKKGMVLLPMEDDVVNEA